MERKTLNRTTSEGITPEEIWDVVNRTHAVGIEGYNLKKKYFDFNQARWEKRRAEILSKHYRKWPPSDWKTDKETGNKIKPHRDNFIDDYIKWSKSFCDIAKANEIKEQLESKGHPIEEKLKPKVYLNLRAKFLNSEKEKAEKRKSLPMIPEWKIASVEKAQEQIKNDEIRKKERQLIHKPNMSKCDRISSVCDAIFVGESIPFYNTSNKENGSNQQSQSSFNKFKYPIKDNLFYPHKIAIWKRAPSWKMFKGKEGKNEHMKIRDNLLEEKAKAIIENGKNQTQDFLLDISGSFEKVNNKQIKFRIAKQFEFDKTEQYINSKEQRMVQGPGPQAYWKTPNGYLDVRIKRAKSVEEETDPPKRYMPREKTDKRLYKPMQRAIF